MNYEDIHFKYCRYQFDNMQVIVGDRDPFPINPAMIASFYIEKDFDNACFPYVELVVLVPFWMYNNVVNDPLNVYVSFNLKYGLFEYELDPGISMTSELSGKFYAVVSESSPNIDEEWQTKYEETEGVINEKYAYGDIVPLQMLLYNTDYYHKASTQVNAILSSTTLVNAATFVLNKAGINKVLMSPPDNRSSYREFKITPIRASHQLWRICNEYAMHKDGSVIFFDLDMCYILAKRANSGAYQSGEWLSTYLMSLSKYHYPSVNSGGCMFYSQDKIYLANIIASTITADSDANISLNTTGNRFTVIDTVTGSVSKVDGTKGSNAEGSKPATTYVYDSGANSSSIIQRQLKENSKRFQCQMTHCPLSMFKPNKTFVVSLEDPKYKDNNGKYRITKYAATFSAEGTYWVPRIYAEFRGGN